MSKRVSASDAKNNFGGLLEDVASLGRVDVMKHGRLVAVVLSPQALHAINAVERDRGAESAWGRNHIIPPERARLARMLNLPDSFDEE